MNRKLTTRITVAQKFAILFLFQSLLTGNSMAQNKKYQSDSNDSLHYLMRESKNGATPSPLLILLHGYGSNENDLFSLGEKVPNNWIVISVRGSYKLAENSYRWYDVQMMNGKIVIHIEEEEKSRKKLLELLTDITSKYAIDNQKIVVAGFSQGANMAQSLGIGDPNMVSGFAVFSGRFVEEFIPYISNAKTLKTKKAFIAHGNNDTMLPKNYSEENTRKLKDLGLQVTYCEDSNGHSISSKQWNEFVLWLQNFN